MKMRTLLLVSAVAMLVSPGVVSPHHIHRSGDIHSNLNRIYYLAENCIASHSTVPRDVFVEDVSHLAENCEDKFFCKVANILHNHKNMCTEELVRTLQMYNNGRNVNCEKTVEGMTSTGNWIGVCRLLEYVKLCVQRRNFSGTQK